jgi:hypothetical protein
MIFDKLKKGGTLDLYFRDIRNILLDREFKGRPRNKILRLKE